MEYNKLTQKVIAAAIEVHKELGTGLLESVYEYCLIEELKNKGINVKSQVKLPIVYKGKTLNKNFYIDLLIENELIIELKAVEIILPVHEVQLVTYLKLADKRLGLLINFNVTLLKNGIRRKVNNYIDE
ncbi:MAG: GxxExxY protein [Bacteroidales bacterium]|nr:GxxExxY protein [Bacteroidales bacterium]